MKIVMPMSSVGTLCSWLLPVARIGSMAPRSPSAPVLCQPSLTALAVFGVEGSVAAPPHLDEDMILALRSLSTLLLRISSISKRGCGYLSPARCRARDGSFGVYSKTASHLNATSVQVARWATKVVPVFSQVIITARQLYLYPI